MPTKAEIARALNIRPQSFTRYVARGCPTHSIAAALEWQRIHVDNSQRFWRDSRRRQADAWRDAPRRAEQSDPDLYRWPERMVVGRKQIRFLAERFGRMARGRFQPKDIPYRDWWAILKLATYDD